MNRRNALALTFLGAAASAPRLARAQSGGLTPLRVGVIPAEVAAEIFYGSDMGFFREHGLDVQIQSANNGAAIAAAVASGSLDVGLSDLMSIVSAHARGLPFVFLAPGIVTSYTAPTFGILVRGDSPIRTARDFNGTTMGVNGLNNISHIPVEAWIDNNGGDSKTMKFVEIPLPQMAAAVAAGTVQSTVPPEPWITAAVEQGERIIFMEHGAIAPEFLLSGFMTTRDWAARNAPVAARFVAAIRETALWANRNHAASAPILAKYTKIPPAVVERMHRGDFAVAFRPELVQPVIDAAARYGVIAKPFPASEIYVARV